MWPSESYLNEGNDAFTLNGRIKGRFASKNVVNLSDLKLTKAEISLLSKRLRFVSTSNHIKKAKLKTELGTYGRMLRLKLHFRNDEKEFDRNKFKPKSIFNLRNKEASIEIYLNSFEEKLEIEIPQNKYSNFSSGEQSTLYNLKNDRSIVMKVIVWDRDDFIKKAEKQLGDKHCVKSVQIQIFFWSGFPAVGPEKTRYLDTFHAVKDIYEEVCNDPGPLITTIHKAVESIRKREWMQIQLNIL